MLAVLRVAALATSEGRADQLLGRVRAAVAAACGPGLHLTRRFVSDSTLRSRIAAAAGVAIYPIQLSAPEVAALIAWPIGSPHVAGLPQSRSRHLPPSGAIARRGLVVARANFPGAERPLAVSARRTPASTCTLSGRSASARRCSPATWSSKPWSGSRASSSWSARATCSACARRRAAGPPRRRDRPRRRGLHPVGYNLLAEGNSRDRGRGAVPAVRVPVPGHAPGDLGASRVAPRAVHVGHPARHDVHRPGAAAVADVAQSDGSSSGATN